MKSRISIVVVVLLVGAAAVFMRYGMTAKSTPGTAAAATGQAGTAAVAPSTQPTAAVPATPGVPPHLTIESMEHSFGKVKPGTPLRFSFVVNNEGPGVLEIQQVNPSCGCTTSSFDKTVAPNKSGSINLAIEKTDTYLGDIVKTATVVTNDPKNANFTLTLRANFAQ
ncbi:MAG: DUF1573 domain-containing protein [Acidobacteriota bacterium]